MRPLGRHLPDISGDHLKAVQRIAQRSEHAIERGSPFRIERAIVPSRLDGLEDAVQIRLSFERERSVFGVRRFARIGEALPVASS